MAHKTFFAPFIGKMAAEALDLHRAGTVKGLTSKGIFLQCGEYILFITDAPYKSPFNIYVPGFERLMGALAVNTEFGITSDALIFGKNEIRIITGNAEIWTPNDPPKISTNHESRCESIRNLLQNISKIDSAKGWMFLYNHDSSLPNVLTVKIADNTRKFTNGYRQHNVGTCFEAASQLLGLGGGLTPSGDDWLAGFVLYQARFHSYSLSQAVFLKELKETLLKLASVKTTTISTNRIMAATRGWAEEPFLQVIDAIATGAVIPNDLAQSLVNFGHSSGVDTILGIAASLDCEK